MGCLCSKGPRDVKVHSENLDGSILPDILQTRFVPPIRHVAPTNPWLSLLTPHQLVEIASAFRKFDRDGDGHIEPREIKTVMANLGCPQNDEQVKHLIASVDTDGNGMIEFDEFVSIMAARMLKKDGDGEIEQAFSLFDNGDGYCHVATIREMLTQMGSQALPESDVDRLLGMLKADADGRVALAEFRALPCWDVQLPGGHRPGTPGSPPKPAAMNRKQEDAPPTESQPAAPQ